MAILIMFSAVATEISTSFASRLKLPSHAKVRSTIQRLGSIARVLHNNEHTPLKQVLSGFFHRYGSHIGK